MDDSTDRSGTTTTMTSIVLAEEAETKKKEGEIKAEARAFALGLLTTGVVDSSTSAMTTTTTTMDTLNENNTSALISSSVARARELSGVMTTAETTGVVVDVTTTTTTTTSPKLNNEAPRAEEEFEAEGGVSALENATTTVTTRSKRRKSIFGTSIIANTSSGNESKAPWKGGENNDDDYSRFVKSLGLHVFYEDDPDGQALFLDDDDEDEFQWEAEGDVEDDEGDVEMEDGVGETPLQDNGMAKLKSDEADYAVPLKHSDNKDDNGDVASVMHHELQEELGWLADEEMEALENLGGGGDAAMAIAMSLTPERLPTDSSETAAPNASPMRSHPLFLTPATPQQQEQLKSLLQQQFQLLFQLSVQSVRAAKICQECVVPPGAAPCNHIDIVDQAVGMLQDLKQHRQDAVRKCIAPQRQLFTRSQFRQADTREVVTAFDISGVVKLNETFAFFDKSVAGQETKSILALKSNAEACRYLFISCGIDYSDDLLPAVNDISTNFSDPKEILGPDFEPPCTTKQVGMLSKKSNLFTASEDNLILRGVAAQGEKKWGQISLHFLPERSSPLINQRYSKLTMFIFKAQGVTIFEDGSLPPLTKYQSLDEVDHDALKKLKKLKAPATVHLNHWTVEEDVTLLKGVQVLGSMWAEIRALLIPHRDRGHLRKRYQMLERRIKNCVNRSNRHDMALMKRIGTPSVPDETTSSRSSLSMTAMAMSRRAKKTTSQTDAAKAVARMAADAIPTSTPPRAHPSAPIYPPGGYYGYQPPPHPQPSPQRPYPQHPPQYPPPPSPQHAQPPQTPYQPPMYHHPPPYHNTHPPQPVAPYHQTHPPQPGAPAPYPYPPQHYPAPYYYGAQPPPQYATSYPGPPPPYYPTHPPALPVRNGSAAGQPPPQPATHHAPLSPPVPHRTTEDAAAGASGDNTNEATAPDESRMAVEHLLLMSASKPVTQQTGASRASKRGRRKGSLFSGVMNRLEAGDSGDATAGKGPTSLSGLHLPTVEIKSPSGKTKAEDTEEEERRRNLTPPVYLPDETLTTSSIGTFHNMASSPFLGNLDGEQSRPMTRTSLFGGPKAAEEDMEAVSALTSLGTPTKKRGSKRKSLFAAVTGKSA